jgi:hypothetical protein
VCDVLIHHLCFAVISPFYVTFLFPSYPRYVTFFALAYSFPSELIRVSFHHQVAQLGPLNCPEERIGRIHKWEIEKKGGRHL